MHIKTCKHCGKQFETPTKAVRYCWSGCFTGRESVKQQERYKKYSPARRAAALAVARAFQRGNLTRQPCEVCGKGHVIAHHDDYAKPLDVRWLCISHHRLHHIKHGPGLNA
jgi:ribosomal protein S27AE